MKKAIDFAICALWVLGTIGGIGYSIYEGAYPVAAGVAALSVMSSPQSRNTLKSWQSDGESI